MTSKRVYYLLIGSLIVLGLAVVGGAYNINTLLVKQSGDLVDAKARLAALNQEQTSLISAKKDIATYAELYKISKSIVPQNKDQAQAVRQIVNLAADTGVSLQSITFPASTLGNLVPGAAAGATKTAGPTATGPSPTLSQLQPVPKIPGAYNLQLVVSSSTDTKRLASYQQLINFLSGLERNRLTALVSTISIAPGGQSGAAGGTVDVSNPTDAFSFILTLDIYIKP